MRPVVRVEWIESERGWGQRPDGYSLHLTTEVANQYISEMHNRETAYYRSQGKPDNYVPDEYSRESSRSLVDIDDTKYDELVKAGGSLRFWR